MNVKLYCTIAAVIATGAIGMMYITPSATAEHTTNDHDWSKCGGPPALGDYWPTKGTWRHPEPYTCDDLDERWPERCAMFLEEGNEFYFTLGSYALPECIGSYYIKWIDGLEAKIIGLESKVSELVLIEKAHEELTEEFDQKNNTIENQETTITDLQTTITNLQDKVDNKNNRIDNLREERNQLQNLADKRLDRIHNLKDKQDITNTSIQDLIDMLQADPNTSTTDILEALNKILQ